ncbi:MAG: LuxR C-terminal-related transcriptional regulator, partial [Cyanobacteria bacterium P01_C01_bin.121]
EQSLSPAVSQLLLQLAEQIAQKSCQYCRLVYESTNVSLEAILANDKRTVDKQDDAEINLHEEFSAVERATKQLGGNLKISIGSTQTVINIQLPQQIDPLATEGMLSPLSEREQEVILRLAHGLRDREIAQELFISDRTVKFHVKNILKKLDVRTRSHAVFEATKQGWLS